MKIVINSCFGGFGLSKEACERLQDLGAGNVNFSSERERANPLLVQVVEELGQSRASGQHAELKVVEVPDGMPYTIEDYDGREHVAEKHRTWG